MKLSTNEAWKHISGDAVVYLTDDQLEALHRLILEVADDIIGFCERNGISYQLGGGSVLGAVRHHGFIPWDDDLDINIPRLDYDKFVDAFPKAYGDKYWLHAPAITKDYALLSAQVRMKGTRIRNHDDLTDECGVFVDIVPMESTYANPLFRFAHGIGCQFYGLVVSSKRIYDLRDRYDALLSESPEWSNSLRAKKLIGKLFSWRSLSKWVEVADRWNSRCKDEASEWVTFPAGRKHFFGELRKRSVFGKGVPMIFENRTWLVPDKYGEYLTKHYGPDYMKMPEKESRERHAYLEVSFTSDSPIDNQE